MKANIEIYQTEQGDYLSLRLHAETPEEEDLFDKANKTINGQIICEGLTVERGVIIPIEIL